jgi:hypothetical protein
MDKPPQVLHLKGGLVRLQAGVNAGEYQPRPRYQVGRARLAQKRAPEFGGPHDTAK